MPSPLGKVPSEGEADEVGKVDASSASKRKREDVALSEGETNEAPPHAFPQKSPKSRKRKRFVNTCVL